jgi:hypothetical protein
MKKITIEGINGNYCSQKEKKKKIKKLFIV